MLDAAKSWKVAKSNNAWQPSSGLLWSWSLALLRNWILSSYRLAINQTRSLKLSYRLLQYKSSMWPRKSVSVVPSYSASKQLSQKKHLLWNFNDCFFLNIWSLWPLCYLAWERKLDMVNKIWLKILLLKRKYWKLIWSTVYSSAVKRSIGSTTSCTITEKVPTRAFSWLKAPTSAFTFKTLLRHYAERALTPW